MSLRSRRIGWSLSARATTSTARRLRVATNASTVRITSFVQGTGADLNTSAGRMRRWVCLGDGEGTSPLARRKGAVPGSRLWLAAIGIDGVPFPGHRFRQGSKGMSEGALYDEDGPRQARREPAYGDDRLGFEPPPKVDQLLDKWSELALVFAIFARPMESRRTACTALRT